MISLTIKYLLFTTLCFVVVDYSDALSCYCKDPCKNPVGCKAGTVTGPCCGCKVCAKIKGESCGGPFEVSGKCASGLTCRKNVPPGILPINITGKCVCGPLCRIFCRFGNVIGPAGCPICKCRKPPVCKDIYSYKHLPYCYRHKSILCRPNCKRCCVTSSCLKNPWYPKRYEQCRRN